MFWKKKIQIKYSYVISFYSTDKVWRGGLMSPDYESVLKFIQKKIKRLADVEKIIIRESKGYDGRHLMGYCPDCGKYLEQDVHDE